MNLRYLLIPFSDYAKKKIQKLNLSIENPEEKHLAIVKEFLVSKNYKFPNLQDSLLEDYFALYPYLRIILSILNSQKYYSVAFDHYYSLIISFDDVDFLLEELKINYDFKNNLYQLNYKDYIFAKIRSAKDKLVNTAMYKGKVFLDKNDLKDFLARYIATKVIIDLPLDVSGVSKEFYKLAEEIKKRDKKKIQKISLKSKKIDYNAIPPCLLEILNELLNGGNPDHMSRYYLATFLFAIKMPFEEVLDIFSHAANYKEDITRYQLEKIKKYSAPSFETLRNMGLCLDEEYNNFKNPVEYYYKKLSDKK